MAKEKLVLKSSTNEPQNRNVLVYTPEDVEQHSLGAYPYTVSIVVVSGVCVINRQPLKEGGEVVVSSGEEVIIMAASPVELLFKYPDTGNSHIAFPLES